ncbi:unnamed protein product, partial [Ectocarpus sp. 13 AM-2016]
VAAVATLSLTPAPTLGTTAPESAPQPTPAPGMSSEADTLAPAASPALGTAAPGSTPQPSQPPASSSEECRLHQRSSLLFRCLSGQRRSIDGGRCSRRRGRRAGVRSTR